MMTSIAALMVAGTVFAQSPAPFASNSALIPQTATVDKPNAPIVPIAPIAPIVPIAPESVMAWQFPVPPVPPVPPRDPRQKPRERDRRLRAFATRVLADADMAGFGVDEVIEALSAQRLASRDGKQGGG